MYPGQVGQREYRRPQTHVDYLLSGLDTYRPECREQLSRDANEVLRQYQSLRTETDVYFTNDGFSRNLIVMRGTIPISHENAQYNIPVAIWFSEQYPLSAPMVYVNPTPAMKISSNQNYVSLDGRVMLSYIKEWSPSRSSLLGLVETCRATFGASPPVVSRQAEPPFSAQPPPAYNSALGGTGSYPGQRLGPPMGGTPPPPPYPTSGPTSFSTPSPAFAVKKSSEDERREVEARKERELKNARQALTVKLSNEFQHFREDMKKALLVEIVTQRKLETGNKLLDDELKSLDRQKEEFESALLEMNTKTVQLETWLEEYDKREEGLSNEETAALAQINLDEAIVPADSASRQLFDCVSETSAIDDLLYYLDRALTNDIIDLQTFLKEVRKHARKQFFAKALGQKIQKHQQQVEMQSRHQQPLDSRPPAYQSRTR